MHLSSYFTSVLEEIDNRVELTNAVDNILIYYGQAIAWQMNKKNRIKMDFILANSREESRIYRLYLVAGENLYFNQRDYPFISKISYQYKQGKQLKNNVLDRIKITFALLSNKKYQWEAYLSSSAIFHLGI